MTIAITAPQKFDFQDIVCVEMMLRFHHLEDAQFFAEPRGGEDGEIIFGRGMPIERAEIQVKGAAGSITIDAIADCLAHTPPRKASDTLLERLLGDPTRLVVLVMSGRCDDAASVYSLPFDWTGVGHPVHTLKQSDAVALLGAFAKVQVPGKDGGSLKSRREAHFRAVAAAIDPAILRIALQRLIILERLDEVELENRCADKLRTTHRIPGDRIPDVLARLRMAVKTAKTQAIDAFSLVRAALHKAAPPPTRPQGYVCRGDERDWVDLLSRENILLLSGPPRVGKTDAARWVAAEFESHGYEIREINEVDTAERFLLEPGDSLRLVVLDDPLGGAHAAPDATRKLMRIAGLAPRLRPNRKLIISQGQEHLLASSRQNALSDVDTTGHKWRDLGTVPATFLGSLWDRFAENWKVTPSLRQFVLDALSKGDLYLEAGCLRHLAVHHARLEGRYDLDRVARIAREDAASLGHALEEDGFQQLLTGLVLASSESEPIALSELSFVIGSGGDGLPGKPKTTAICYGMGGKSTEYSDDHSYDTPPRLGPEDEERLGKLERRQIVKVDAGDRVAFTHPFYRSAAESILGKPTRQIALKIVTALERGLFCLAPPTSRASSRNFDWVYDQLATQPKAQAELVDCAVSGLKSYFPSTRDFCFTFLLRRLTELPHDRQMELSQWVSAVTFVSLESLEWVNGDARLPLGKTLDMWDHHFKEISKEKVAAELLILEDTGSGYLSPERAVKVLMYYKKNPTKISISAMGRLLSYDEAAIRAKSTELWLMVPRIEDKALLQRIFSEDHPSVALAALKGTIKGYNNWSAERQQAILAGLQAFASLPASAVAMLDRLVVFDRIEYTGEDPPWEIFEKLLPVVMRVIPENAAFIDARLFGVAETARSVLPASSMVDICDGWIDWLERNSTEGRLPSEFSLGVAKILLEATKADPDLRKGRIKRLLDFPGTGALISFIADVVDIWDDLVEDERTCVENTLTSTRTDVLWLKAVVLTRTNVPKLLQVLILGDELSLDSDAETLLKAMDPKLFCAVIHVYCGLPQPLWWLGTHHRIKQRWEPVIEMIAATPSHPLFVLAWEEITFGGKGKRVAKLINAVGAEHAERMLDLLIRIKVRCTGDFMPDAWSAVLGLAPDLETRSCWISKMAEYAPAILDGLSDLWDWLRDDDIKRMLKLLGTDTVPLEYLHLISKTTDGKKVSEEIQTATTELLEIMFLNLPPRLFKTCNQIIDRLKKLHIDDPELFMKINDRREKIFAEMDSIKNDCKLPEENLDGWIGP